MKSKHDFSTYDCAGWATKYGVECSDGITIEQGAFDHLDGSVVPLVFGHGRKDVKNYIGKALLKATPEGLRSFNQFNNTPEGLHAKECVEHGDLDSLSIFAVNLAQRGMTVRRGDVKEVSLVISGANPKAKIEYVEMSHGDDADGSAIYYSGETLDNILGGSFEHADDTANADDSNTATTAEDKKTIKQIYNDAMAKLTEIEQQTVMYVFGEILDAENSGESDNSNNKNAAVQQSAINEGGNDMKINAFEEAAKANAVSTASSIQHAAAVEKFALAAAKKAMDTGVQSFRAYLEHAIPESKVLQQSGVLDEIGTYIEHSQLQHDEGDEPVQTSGIKNIDLLFPEATAISNKPEFINRRTEWVTEILTKTSHRPFARIKSLYADITAEEARAKGYTTGDQKDDEVFELLSRETYPQTVYKENRLDRDDVLDATTIDVFAFMKEEMRIKYDEEVARAMLIGDGRSANHKHKIKEDKIRPVLTDDELFTIHYPVTLPAGATTAEKADIILDASVLSFEDYDGTGNTVMFVDPELYRNTLVLKDDIGNRKYKNVTEIATAAGVNKIIPCPYLKNLTRTDKNDKVYDVHAVTLDLSDYVFGSDKGGNLSFFDDFDINFNKMIYLMEGRMSGALIKPKTAIVLETEQAAG